MTYKIPTRTEKGEANNAAWYAKSALKIATFTRSAVSVSQKGHALAEEIDDSQ